MGSVPMPPSPDELRARAAAIREELKELEAEASVNRRPNAELAEPKRVRAKAYTTGRGILHPTAL